jgi:hypothetical protein
MDQITPEEWEAAKRHFDEVFEEYKKLLGRPGVIIPTKEEVR